MNTLVIELQYFPNVTYYKKVIDFSYLLFDVYDPFRKMSFRNRMRIAGAEGPLLLSVPLTHGREQRRPMREVEIANLYPWQDQHWKTICSCYNRSPWFEYYRDSLEELYRTPFERLADWNLACMQWTWRQLGWTPDWGLTDSYQPFYPADTYVDLRNSLQTKTVDTGTPAIAPYRQVFEDRTGFVPGLSILDLLCSEGKNALNWLRKD